MPLLADRLRLQQACPFWRVLGIELIEWGAGRAVTRMRPSPLIATSQHDGRIDPLALVGMLDDAFSNAISTILPLSVGISTLDLRMELAKSSPPEGAVTAETLIALVNDHSATAQVRASDNQGLVATGTAMFTLGGYPGGTLPDFGLIGRHDAASASGPFTRLIGLGDTSIEVALRGDNANVVGWETGNSLHGGVIGAVLMAACVDRARDTGEIMAGQRLAALYIRYLRPGSAAQPMYASSQLDRQGRSASFMSASCFHESGKDIAHGHAIFVNDDARPD